ERGDGLGAADAERLVDGVRGVEPYESEETVGADAVEKVSDLLWLSRGRHGARLSDEDWGIRECAHRTNRRPEQRGELPVWLEIVAVDPDPGDVRAAGPPLPQVVVDLAAA